MIDQENINKVIADKLREVTGCEVVKSNLAKAPIPTYPYVSFTILNTDTHKGRYSASEEIRFIPLTQTWSFTVQSDQDNEAQIIALKIKDWLEDGGTIHLGDHGIVVQSVGAISNRDTFLTLNYEYRKGFDAIFSLISVKELQNKETIERAVFKRSE